MVNNVQKKEEETHTMTKPWERQPRESDTSWLWFRIYRDLLHERSPRKVIEYIQNYNKDLKHHKNKKEKKGNKGKFRYGMKELPQPELKNIQNLSSIHNWRKRVTAYDNYLDEKQREQREQEFLEEELEYLRAMKEIRQATFTHVEALNNNDDPNIRTTSKLHALKSASQSIDTTYKDLRLAHGRSTENRSTDLNAEVTQEVTEQVNVDFNAQLTDKKFHDVERKYLEDLLNDHSK